MVYLDERWRKTSATETLSRQRLFDSPQAGPICTQFAQMGCRKSRDRLRGTALRAPAVRPSMHRSASGLCPIAAIRGSSSNPNDWVSLSLKHLPSFRPFISGVSLQASHGPIHPLLGWGSHHNHAGSSLCLWLALLGTGTSLACVKSVSQEASCSVLTPGPLGPREQALSGSPALSQGGELDSQSCLLPQLISAHYV